MVLNAVVDIIRNNSRKSHLIFKNDLFGLDRAFRRAHPPTGEPGLRSGSSGLPSGPNVGGARPFGGGLRPFSAAFAHFAETPSEI
ncbi:MAG: hypothetical protein HSCHL_2099 [Hydrogenibacillus schlegelii]|uniref:Uncharacterized protein n=1 Tax=Hydrogenibacillus schlegelii TaxID=1484 RepID=A0A2T5GA06_HYDSH|nr:MAG: hypothetical protein HSCHL_2099 [Hydrogenibacillus schlegelii]